MKSKLRIMVVAILVMALIMCASGCTLSDKSGDSNTYEVTKINTGVKTKFDKGTVKLYFDKNAKNDAGNAMLQVKTDDVNGGTLVGSDVLVIDDSYILDDGDNGLYILVQLGYDNDVVKTVLVSIHDKNMQAAEEIDYHLTGELESTVNKTFAMATRINVLGTYEGQQTFQIKDDELVTEDDTYIFNKSSETKLTLEQKIKAQTVDGDKITVKAGEDIYPTGTDNKSIFYFENKDGKECQLKFKKDGGDITINGDDQYDVFKNLPYSK